MERYETFRSIEEMPDRFTSAILCDGDEGVVLKLCLPSLDKMLVLEFGRVPALRRTLEECSLGGFEGNWDEPNKVVSCFIVHNSKWVAEFDGAELIHYPNPKHYVFMTQDQCIEVLSCDLPKVRWEHVG